jgi:hypothetical protein
MRFLIQVSTNWHVHYVREDTGEYWEHDRELRRLPEEEPNAEAGVFPLPPAKEAQALAESGTALDELAIRNDRQLLWSAYQDIVQRNLGRQIVEKFGRYLFYTLIGADVWTWMTNAAEHAGAEVIELALVWGRGERYLHRLNWEMMATPSGFLAQGNPGAGSPGLVTTTRMIDLLQNGIRMLDLPQNTRPVPRQIDPPPRVLFVIGSPIDDDIRPGAEYLSLLRQMRMSERSFHSLVLRGEDLQRGASPQELKTAIRDFRPDVVHFICHGNVDELNGGYLELAPDPNEDRNDPLVRRRYARQIMSYLKVGSVPPVVVLSVCYSGSVEEPKPWRGQMLATEYTAPLAAELIEQGVPVVVAMAGEISDRACRLFTRAFGAALLEGTPLNIATALGRREALIHDPNPAGSPDWAFPTLFISPAVRTDYVPVHTDELDQDPAVVRERWIRDRYSLHTDPVFCGREEFFAAYYNLFRSKKKALLIWTRDRSQRLGRTRLLEELTAQAIRDGHVPCLYSPSKNEPKLTNIGQFGLKILEKIGKARKVLGLSPPFDSALLGELNGIRPVKPTSLFGTIIDQYTEEAKDKDALASLGPNQVKDALLSDLDKLIQEARGKKPKPGETYPLFTNTSRVLVLLDDVDEYDAQLQIHLFDTILGAFAQSDPPVPVIMTCSLDKMSHPEIKDRAIGMKSPPAWLRLLPLAALPNTGEDMLAYESILLHPSEDDERRSRYSPMSDRSWVVKGRLESKEAKESQGLFRDLLLGIPGLFAEGHYLYAAAKHMKDVYLVEANDEDLLRDLLNNLAAMKRRNWA